MAARQSLELVPLEVWEEILKNLKDEDLLTCRMVCKDWRNAVDESLEGQIWKPHFAKYRVPDALSLFLIKCKGTRFSSAQDVEVFITNMMNAEGTVIPFINNTLIMECRSTKEYEQLCIQFPTLVANFGDFVHHCIYFVHHEVPISVRNIPMLSRLKNMRSLTIYCADWAKPGIHHNLNMGGSAFAPQPLKHLTSLSFLGDQSHFVMDSLFERYGAQIKRLNCWGQNLSDEAAGRFTKGVARTFRNLEEFKICDISSSLLQYFSNKGWPLKRLSFKMNNRDDVVYMADILNAIAPFSGTLEALHFQVEEQQLQSNTWGTGKITFPKVSDLRVPYYLGTRHVHEIARRFMNVKYFQLVEGKEGLGNPGNGGNNTEATLDRVVEPLWAQLPATVDVVSVRYRRHGNAPWNELVYKYQKKRPGADNADAMTGQLN